MSFYDNFVTLCLKTGKSRSAILDEIGISRSNETRWSKGFLPSNRIIAKLSNYFDVPAEQLMYGDCEEAKVAFQGEIPKYTQVNPNEVTRLRIIEKVMKLKESDLEAVFALVSHLVDNSPIQDI